MKGLLKLFSQGDRCILLAEASGKHVEKFGHFQDFLAGNRDALRALAEMEMLYYSGSSFTVADISFHYEQLFSQVRLLVRALDELTDHRYPLLDQKIDEVNLRVGPILRPAALRQQLPLVVSLEEVPATATDSVGGKAAKLAVITRDTSLRVPPGFVVTASGYDLFLRANKISDMILDELAGLTPGDVRLAEVSARLTELVLGAEVPGELIDLLHARYRAIEERTWPGILLAMRSSAVREDSDASFAGQYHSVLNVTEQGLADAYREVVASSFSPRAIVYRQMLGIDITETPMCVLGLAMVDAAVSGVLYTADPSSGDTKNMQISAVPGLGEQLVSGAAQADTFTVEKSEGTSVGEESAGQGSTAGPGAVAGHRPLLVENELRHLRQAGNVLERLFGGPQDIEWAIDGKRQIFILQCRPLGVAVKAAEAVQPPDTPPLLRGGATASFGIAAGPVCIVDESTALSAIPDHVVLVARTAAPRYAEVMGRLSGLLTEIGSTTCHLASVAREFGVPMAVNVADGVSILAREGQVTLFAQEPPAVYRGILVDERQPVKRRILDSTVHRKLRAVLDHLSPLHLTDPDHTFFQPENCTSMHDIIRFAHEQAVREMFSLSSHAEGQAVSVRLTTHIPLVLHLVDLGGGLQQGLSTCDTVVSDHFTSTPLKALWRGFTHPGINWSGTVQFDGSSFFSRMAASATSEFGPEPGGDSYALIGAEYLNLSAKFGYHYATLDTFCGDDPDHNYLSLQFSGGAGTYFGKSLRLQFLGKVLDRLGASVTLRGDLLEASFNRFGRAEMVERLDQLGRLLACSRLLDMAIADQEDVDLLVAEFMNGNYDLLNHKGRVPLDLFYTHLGRWRQVEQEGMVHYLSDGSPWMNSLSAGVAGLISKTFGQAYQELLDTIGAYYYFPLAVAKCGAVHNATIELGVNPVRGNIDQAGGLVFALRDIGNYFVFRINALEDNAILFEFINNRRFERARLNLPITRGQWHTLQAVVSENRASLSINDRVVFDYRAERPLHGHTGMWTKADSVTLFSGMRINGQPTGQNYHQ